MVYQIEGRLEFVKRFFPHPVHPNTRWRLRLYDSRITLAAIYRQLVTTTWRSFHFGALGRTIKILNKKKVNRGLNWLDTERQAREFSGTHSLLVNWEKRSLLSHDIPSECYLLDRNTRVAISFAKLPSNCTLSVSSHSLPIFFSLRVSKLKRNVHEIQRKLFESFVQITRFVDRRANVLPLVRNYKIVINCKNFQ